MAEHRPGGEPTEPPSERKLLKARRRGEVPKSREVVSVAVFIGAAGMLAWIWPDLLNQLRDLMQRLLSLAASDQLSATGALRAGSAVLLAVSAPVLLVAFGAALLGSFVQVGALVTLHPVKPDLQRLHPLKNLGQVFGRQAWFELGKSVLKVVGIGAVALGTLWESLPRLLSITGRAPEQGLEAVASCLATLALRVGLLVIALAIVDAIHQRHRFFKRHRMTRHEVKQEQREAEGDPQRKSERQRLHREILEHQMLQAVSTADCVIINPTHVAVALRYDAATMDAPRVVARGHRLTAAKIRRLARDSGVPILRDVPLARALVELELDDEIPAELYEAVAEVLRFVERLSERG